MKKSYNEKIVDILTATVETEGIMSALVSAAGSSGQESMIPNLPYSFTGTADGKKYKFRSINQRPSVGDKALIYIDREKDGDKANMLFDAIVAKRKPALLDDPIAVEEFFGGETVDSIKRVALITKKFSLFGGRKKKIKALVDGNYGKTTKALVLKRESKGEAHTPGKSTIYLSLLLLIKVANEYLLVQSPSRLVISRKQSNYEEMGVATTTGFVVDLLYDPEDPTINVVKIPEDAEI